MSHFAVVGATGVVGRQFLDLMEEKCIFPDKLSLFASKKNQGKTVEFNNKSYSIQSLREGCFEGIDIAFFSAGADISQKWALKATNEGAFVVDNSSAFRMDPQVPLVVPEINPSVLTSSQKLIANPNCSTIQMCMVLSPLHQAFELESVQAATYQSASGAGSALIEQLKKESFSKLSNEKNSCEFAFNCVPKIGNILESGFSTEDIKMDDETRKILNLGDTSITAFTVRVPTFYSHGEVLWVHLKKPPKNREVLIGALKGQKGLTVLEGADEYCINDFVTGKDNVYVGRIHQDPKRPQTWLMWVLGDNVRKGAALNGLQISQLLMDKWIEKS